MRCPVVFQIHLKLRWFLLRFLLTIEYLKRLFNFSRCLRRCRWWRYPKNPTKNPIMEMEAHQTIQMAIDILDKYPDRSHPSRFYDQSSQHIRPPTLLRALLDYAPSDRGKYSIALEITRSFYQSEETNKVLEELTEWYWSMLLVPCMSSFYSSSLIQCEHKVEVPGTRQHIPPIEKSQ